MRLTNLNPDRNIGASAWLLEIEGHRLLLDAGTHPKRDGRESLPLFDDLPPVEVDAIAVSHCHHDHVGSLPVAMRRFPRAHVLMTELSYFLVERVLHNSVNVMRRQREELRIPEYPLYTHSEVDEMAPRFQGFRYDREVEWAAHHKSRTGARSPTLEFRDAGHTLGAAGVMVRGGRETFFYTGDVSFRDQTLLRGARFDGVEAEVLLMETTRGDRAVPPGFTREAEAERLLGCIRAAQRRRGSVLLPTFALGRTQEILGLLALWMREGELREQPVYIGGLGRVFTEIYDLESHRANRNHTNLLLHEALELVVLDRDQCGRLPLGRGKLFVMTAGMLTENTAAHALAVRLMGEARHAIFFVGYADPDTPGGRLKAAPPGEPFLFSPSAGEQVRHCELDDFDLTAHANRDDLLEFVGQVNPRVVVLGHGDDEARAWFAGEIGKRHPRIRVCVPGPGETVEM
ncbi:MAG: MBL fold metallo-hydrolase [Verrucomicrobiales bacterium]|nr:MBL fold metallo-hydrolase [Verrucomicrobiales bacterium]